MAKFDYVKNRLDYAVVGISDFKTFPGNLKRIFFIDNQTELLPASVYLADLKTAKHALENTPINPGSVLIVCDTDDISELEPLYKNRGFVLLGVNESLTKTYNTVNEILNNYHSWRDGFLNIHTKDGGFADLITYSATEGACSTALFDKNFKLIAHAGKNAPALSALAEKKAAYLKELGKPFTSRYLEKCKLYHTEEGRRLYYSEINGYSEGTLYFALECEDNDNTDYSSLALLTSKNISRHIILSGQNHTEIHSDFELFIDDIMNGKLSVAEQIKARIAEFAPDMKQWFNVGVVQFDENYARIPFSFAIQRLSELLPGWIITEYNEMLVLMQFSEERSLGFPFDREQIDTALKEMHAWMGLSDASSQYTTIKTLITLAFNTLKFARRLGLDHGHRSFLHNEFCVYDSIDYCMQKYSAEQGEQNFRYLIHPAVTILTRYDSENGTNLRDILF